MLKEILRQAAVVVYSIGSFELYKYLLPGVNKDWIFILVFTAITPLMVSYCLKDHDEWKKRKEINK